MPYTDKEKQQRWYERNRERLRPYKADWARRHAADAKVRYRQNRSQAIQRAQANYRARRSKVAPEELARLRRPDNLLEVLAYGPRREPVCLGCGGIFANLARHCTACPAEPMTSAAYRKRWGYMKSNPLASQAEQARRRKAQASLGALEARTARKERAEAALAAWRATQAGLTRGPRRAEQRLRHRGERRGARPGMQKVPDSEVLRIMARNLTVTESAKRVGLSQTAYWRRVQRLDPAHFGRVRQQRHAVNRYIFDLRAWLWRQAGLPTLARVLDRHTAEMRNRSATAAAFNPFLAALESELLADPAALARLADRTHASGSPRTRGLIPATAVIALASKVFKRARAAVAAPVAAAKMKGGRPKGMTAERQREAQAIMRACDEFQAQHGTKRGMWAYAARKVLGARSDSRSAIERARWLVRQSGGRKNSEEN